MNKHIIRYLPLTLIGILILVLVITGLHQHLSFQSLKAKHDLLKEFATSHPFITPLIFMGVFILSACVLIPDAFFLCLIAGFLFPIPLALLYVGLSEAIGSLLYFFAVYLAFGKTTKKPAVIKKLEKGMQKNAASYLLFLKISHVFPYWLVNGAAAYLEVRPWTFFWTSFISFLPGAFVFVEAGSGLEVLLKEGAPISIQNIFNGKVQIALIALACCSLIPILIKRWRK